MTPDPSKARRPTLGEKLEEELRRLGLQIDGLSQEEARQAVSEAWLAENREALESSCAWIEKNGLPLAQYRTF